MENLISISEARKILPQLLKEIQKEPGKIFKITVRNEVVAEIKAPPMIAEPGQAAKKLLAFRKRHPFVLKTRPVEAISENTKIYLSPAYGLPLQGFPSQGRVPVSSL